MARVPGTAAPIRAAAGGAIVIVAGGEPIHLSGGAKAATNQRMELTAAIQGLKALKTPSSVTVYADSS